jgi:NADH-quinone oxidoreductase subunit M
VLVVGIGFYPAPVLDVVTPTVESTLDAVGVTDGGN